MIGSVDQIAAAIRLQLARQRQSVGSGSTSIAKRSEAGASVSAKPIEELVSRKIKSIDPNDPQRPRKALRIFFEAVLITEFGDALGNDPAFYRLVDKIQEQVESDETLQPMIAEAIGKLVTASH